MQGTKGVDGEEHKGRALSAYLTEAELAERWRISVRTLQKKRLEGGFVPYRKFGSAVRYKLEEVVAFETACLRSSTSEGEGR